MAIASNTKTPAAGRATGGIRVALIGCSHRTAPVEIRERVAFTCGPPPEA